MAEAEARVAGRRGTPGRAPRHTPAVGEATLPGPGPAVPYAATAAWSQEPGSLEESTDESEEEIKEPDCEKTCPLLLRVFTTNNGCHHRLDEFSHGNVPSSELQIYTRMDATLKELTSLVKEGYPEARKKGTHFKFAIVFTDLKRPGYRVKEISSTMSSRKGTDDSMTLQSRKFQIGDYLGIAITPPNRAPPPSGRMRLY
ncbi:Histone deacetylase complex subunit SAP18 [Tupaia chinensis]|uniref:Histone deacetylase complex subunit SAP18 n=1 Tax=Tupaia chinensis TaxID=246437 RepID=L9L6X0_TUPCH|nr:Histone deacetylase complex subunit SAP18 [Tupaia chinensis]